MWDTAAILEALVARGIAESVCDSVGAVVLDDHDDAVPQHSLGDVLLKGGVPPVIALRVVNDLVQVRVVTAEMRVVVPGVIVRKVVPGRVTVCVCVCVACAFV